MVEQEVAGHTAPTVRKQNDECLCLVHFLLFIKETPVQRMVLSTFKMDLPPQLPSLDNPSEALGGICFCTALGPITEVTHIAMRALEGGSECPRTETISGAPGSGAGN